MDKYKKKGKKRKMFMWHGLFSSNKNSTVTATTTMFCAVMPRFSCLPHQQRCQKYPLYTLSQNQLRFGGFSSLISHPHSSTLLSLPTTALRPCMCVDSLICCSVRALRSSPFPSLTSDLNSLCVVLHMDLSYLIVLNWSWYKVKLMCTCQM